MHVGSCMLQPATFEYIDVIIGHGYMLDRAALMNVAPCRYNSFLCARIQIASYITLDLIDCTCTLQHNVPV